MTFRIHKAKICILAIALTAVFQAIAKTTGTDGLQAEKARKADYYFMEAMRQEGFDKKDDYYMLIRQANRLDQSDTSVGFAVGYLNTLLAQSDSITFTRGYRLMENHFLAHPEDLYSSYTFGNLNAMTGRQAKALQVWTTLDSIYPDKPEIAIKYGDALAASPDTANWTRAIDVYSRIERTEGLGPQVTSRKISVLINRRDTINTINELDRLLKSAPTNSTNHVFVASVYSLLGQKERALVYFDKACELDPENGMAYFARANFFKENGETEAYDREVFRTLKLESLELDTKLQLLTGYVKELYTDTLQQPRIKELFNVLIEQHPHEVEIHDLYTSYDLAVKDYAGALEQVGYAIDIDPAKEDRWRMKMSLYGQDRRWTDAIATARQALRYHPDSPTIHMLMGIDYSMTDSCDIALKHLQRALSLSDSIAPDMRPDVLTAIGDVYYKSQQPDSAFVYYEQALSLDPGNLLALNNCAYYLACEGRDLDKAERMIATVVREKPDDSTSLDTYAWVLFRKTEYARAKEMIDRAIASYDTAEDGGLSAEILHHAGDIYFMTGNPDKALQFWRDALKAEPDNDLLKRKVRYKTYFYE